MKRASWWAALAITCLTAAAATGPSMPHASARTRAAAKYQQRLLAGPNGHYDGRLYQTALRARARMLAHSAAQAHSWLPQGPTARATAPSVINWTEIGPNNVGGRINAIWIDPKNPQHLIAGAAGGGLWQSNDGAASWTAVAEFPGSLAVGAIAQLPNGTLLVGTGDSVGYQPQPGTGILASTDNGQTWTPINGTAPKLDTDFWSYVNSIAVSTNGLALASTSSGIARSSDGGQTWTHVYPAGGATTPSYAVAFDPNSPSDAVADIDQGAVVYSIDGGQTWAKGSGLPTYTSTGERVSLAFDPAVGGSVYALVDNSPHAAPSGEIFHSVDGGKTWVLLVGTGAFVDYQSGTTYGALCAGSECQGWYDNTIIVIPVAGSAPTIVTGGVVIFRSKDGGATWSDAEWGLGGGYHPDIHAFAYDATNNLLYQGDDGGIYKQILNTAWQRSNTGLADTQFYSVTGHANDFATSNASVGHPLVPILAGAQDNGTEMYLGYVQGAAPTPGNWAFVFGGDGGMTQVDPANANYIYGEYVSLGLFYSNTAGPYAQYFSPEPPDQTTGHALFIAPFVLVPNGNSPATQMLAGGRSLWLGNNIQNGVPTWTSLKGSTPLTVSGNFVTSIGVDPESKDDVWVGYIDGELWHTTNATTASDPTWTQVGLTSLPSNWITSIWVQPGQPNIIYLTYASFSVNVLGVIKQSHNVYVTNDGGQTWMNIGAGLPPGPVNSLITNPAYPKVLYAATLTGIYTSADGGQTWLASSQGPANTEVTQLSWFDASNPNAPVMLAATYGRGAWLGSPTLNPTPTLTSLNPALVTLGTPATMVTLTGTGFVSGSTVTLDGASIAATYVSSTQLQVTAPAATLATAGVHTFIVSNPIPGGGSSASASLTVTYPVPAISSLSPNSVVLGTGGFTLTVNGSGFESASTVEWNNHPLTTSFISGNTLTATVPSSDLSAVGNVTVSVVTPAPGGGTANATFAVNYPAPVLTSISPTSVQSGSSAVTLTVTGTNFVSASTIDWNGTALSTTYVSATQLTATVPAGDLAAATSAAVTVVTPAPGGGTSSAISFAVSAPPPAPGGSGGGALSTADLLALAGLYLLSLRLRNKAAI